jgi:hypothetical protein
MLPDNKLSTVPVLADYYSPDDITPVDATWPLVITSPVDYELGGVNVNDNTGGMLLKNWQFYCHNDNLYAKADGVTDILLATSENIVCVAGSFDSAMMPYYAFTNALSCLFYWYNYATTEYEVIALPYTADPRLCLDDKRLDQAMSSSVLLFYLNNGFLCFRAQNESFQVERQLAQVPGTVGFIGRVGMTKANRLQIELLALSDIIEIEVVPGIGCDSSDWELPLPPSGRPWTQGDIEPFTWGMSGCSVTEWPESLCDADTWVKHSCEQLGPGGSTWNQEGPIEPTLPCP